MDKITMYRNATHTFIKCLMWMILASVSLVVMNSCSDEDENLPAENPYGYIQLKLYKQASRALMEGNPLNRLDEARKIELSMIHKGKSIKQSLNLYATGVGGGEFMLTSENLKLATGEYQIVGYVIYGAYKEGTMAEILQVGSPDNNRSFTITSNHITVHPLYIESVAYGSFIATMEKVLPEMEMTRADGYTFTDLFDYDNIDSIKLVFSRNVDGINYREEHKVKAWRKKNERYFHTDTLTLQTGDYTLVRYELSDKKRKFMYAADTELAFTIRHFEFNSQVVPVEIPESEALHDYIALRQIWEAMDGKNWSFNGDSEEPGANWIFEFEDGTPRPIDAWGNQPGVELNAKGRVVSLNLGAFNPLGVVPAAIGQLTELQILYLGTHDEEFVGDVNDGTGKLRYSPYALMKSGTDIREHRLDIARERTSMRRKGDKEALYRSALIYPNKKEHIYKYIKTYAQAAGEPANRITGIDEAIGKLENLEMLFIANAQIERLPKSIGQLSKLTDLELFNLPLTELDGTMFEGLPELISVNMSGLYKMSSDDILAALEKLCLNCPNVQLLYINDNKLATLPENLYRMSDLRLLDAAFNKITSVPSIQPIAPVQLILDFNKISTFPADFCGVDDMELFTCVANNLQQFPAFLSNMEGGYAIEEIDLTTNKMHGFQEGFRGIRVEKLSMAMNEMGKREGDKGVGEFPREFADTKSEINYLVLANNHIDTIRNAALKDFYSLQALDCAGNNLKDLPNGFNTTNLPNLSGVEFSYNQFREFPDNVLNVARMSQLLMASQGYYRDEAETKWVRSMTQWPAYLHEHSGLLIVDFSGNDFRTVTTFPSNLNSLDVSNNPNIKMTVPQYVSYRIQNGMFGLTYDEDQDITFAN
ncbi:MAG: DUF4458 domain-containing protein [Bacteroidaceae bacterium]|nr:DUF4458 domain-containing protein [Bacteroidaceae bacterium]